MANIIIRPGWQLQERLVTAEQAYWHRREFLRRLGFTGAGLLAASWTGCTKSELPQGGQDSNQPTQPPTPTPAGTNAPAPAVTKVTTYPAPRNPQFNPSWPLSEEQVTSNYNNFYEFSTDKERVAKLVGPFTTSPWTISISGLVNKPLTIDVDTLVKEVGLEERIYRFRCVEAWAMVVPWTGFPLSKLLAMAEPKSSAKFVRMETFNRPEQCPGMRIMRDYPWPYFEGLRMDEAMNPLTLVATGIYGKPMAKQFGAPIRLVVPWKYGYKSIKSIVKLELIEEQPKTFWEVLWPEAYPFESNVDPNVPHPKWSQASERMVDSGDRERTQMYNGYGQWVASMYGKV